MKIKRALISVSDKQGLESLARKLHQLGVEIISTGGTGALLNQLDIPFIPIEKITGNPEAFGGRMKTISFQVLSALLFRREHKEDSQQASQLGIVPIDLVVCNLYPFARVAASGAGEDELIENIDVGGPTMIRAAAKNFQDVLVCTDPADYSQLLQALERDAIDLNLRRKFALAAFKLSANYEQTIAAKLSALWEDGAESLFLGEGKELRYGENPHQQAKIYSFGYGLAAAQPLQGKELSYNNFLDIDAAYRACADLYEHFKALSGAVIVKHLNPCGMALGQEALAQAWSGDPVSSFGGIVCTNFEMDAINARFLMQNFVEVVVAPKFSNDAREIFSKKKNLRLLQLDFNERGHNIIRSVTGGLLVQQEDTGLDEDLKTVTQMTFPKELQALARFGILAGKHLRSNAIVLVEKNNLGMRVVGAGMGNPNRLLSLRQAIDKARENGVEDLSSLLLISDAFFPFADSIELAASSGIRYIVEPGGSIRDQEVISACDKLGVSMCFTGKRHFRH